MRWRTGPLYLLLVLFTGDHVASQNPGYGGSVFGGNTGYGGSMSGQGSHGPGQMSWRSSYGGNMGRGSYGYSSGHSGGRSGGYYGGYPESSGRSDHIRQICQPDCVNGGVCIAPQTCQCPSHTYGEQCQFLKKSCPDAPAVMNALKTCRTGVESTCVYQCRDGYTFHDGTNSVSIYCDNGNWVLRGQGIFTASECSANCIPPCQNGGICVSPNSCQCPADFYGPYCQMKKKKCDRFPPPMNSAIACNPQSCTITCAKGHKFPDGSSVANVVCKDGEWKPSHKDWKTVPACRPTCSPECQNGGICLSYNVCQCPASFKGPQCQYSHESCSPRKMAFNGQINCKGDDLSNNCTIQCPKGLKFGQTPASVYICLYSNGMFFPQPIPTCIHDDGLQSELGYIFGHTESKNQYRVIQAKAPTKGTCFMWKNDHYKTFDGKVFSFKSDCVYTLVSDVDNMFHIQTPSLRPDCNPEVENNCVQIKIFVNDKQYLLAVNDYGQPIIVKDSYPMNIPIQLPGLRAEMGSHYIKVSFQTTGVNLLWDLQDFVEITVSESQWNRTTGLCGRIDGFKDNDLAVAHDSLQEYASLSRVDTLGQICQENIVDTMQCEPATAMEAHQFCTEIMADKRFETCKTVVNILDFFESCKWEICNCQAREQCGCDSISMFVRECKAHGIHLPQWRDERTCPMKCSGDRIYMACGKEVTCGGAETDGGDCEEGCFCPEGTFLSGESCVAKEECPCHLQGQSFPPGHVIVKECNTCNCVDGTWACTAKECESRCEIIGDPHYTTFDKKSYDFMGKCSYYLLKTDGYSVEAENVPCDGSISENMGYSVASIRGMASCTKSVTVRIGETVIKLKQAKDVTVNGEDQTLPVSLKHAYIRHASSIFVLVELSDGIEIWWDGETRVYIHAPPSYRANTKGLCGTFNGNQRDDFLTPEGDIEQNAISFANKWKTRDTCDDKVLSEPQNPCDVNVQNKETAIKYCLHLTSKLFSECHLLVYPERYYENCLFDMCSCNGEVSKCLCPILAAYAKECSHQGVQVNWRPQIRECGIRCPRGQQFQVCGDSCVRSCQDLSRQKKCEPTCVEGCNCPSGLTLDHRGQCIPISKCPCFQNGVEYPAGHKEIRLVNKRKELCTCINAVWECKRAKTKDLKMYPNDTLDDTCNAEKNQVYSHCEPSEPITCQNMHENREVQHSEAVCYGGCVCKKGYILDSLTKDCVLPHECPCHHGGKSYKDGEQIQEECNTCVCNSGKWSCTNHVCPGTCTAWGDAHFKTFDDKIYDFQGSCEYVFSEGILSDEEKFNVVIEVVPCGSSGVSCSKAVTLTVGVGEDQEVVSFSDNVAKPVGSILKKITIREAGLFIFADVPDLGLVFQWDKGTRIALRADNKWKSKLKGLCGNYNDDSNDDFQSPGGGGVSEVSAHLFGDSWKLYAFCPEAKPMQDACDEQPGRKPWAMNKCGTLKSSLFKPCHNEIPVEPYYQRCVYDTCGCDQGGDCECLCTALSAYAQECNAHGVHIKWRSQQLCPIQCDETCSEYSPCIQTCPPETCDNILLKKTLPDICSEDTCVEGCQLKPCPDGEIYKNATDLKCIPTEKCKPPCMIIDGKEYKEGDQIEGDDCYSCYCSRNKKVCSGQPCTTVVTTPAPEEVNMTCVPGWSPWFNRHHPSPPLFGDIEPLPSLDDFDLEDEEPRSGYHPLKKKMKRSPICTEDMMIDIECRTADGKIPFTETDENIECSLTNGLICKGNCSDYEIRVHCYCGGTTVQKTTKPVVGSTTVLKETLTPEETTIIPTAITTHKETPCDVMGPLKKHKECDKYYQCQETMAGPEWIERECAPSTMFNPKTMSCDWPTEVIPVRPECAASPIGDDLDTYDEDTGLITCPPGTVSDTCALNCGQLCHYYEHDSEVKEKCKEEEACLKGCVPTNRSACPSGHRWRDSATCVLEEDCTCLAPTGEMVKPTAVVKVSDCEYCMCLNNKLICDKSACATTKPPIQITERVTELPETTGTILIIPTTVTAPERCDPNMLIPLLPELPESAFSASSSIIGGEFEPHNARLNEPGVWKPSMLNNEQYLEIDLGKVDSVYGISTIGSPEALELVNSYYVLYSVDNNTYSYVTYEGMPELYFGPSVGSDVPRTQVFFNPVEARYIRVNPVSWTNEIALKVEVYGCANVSTTVAAVTTTTEIPTLPTTIPTTVAPVCNEAMSAQMNDKQISVSSSQSGQVTAALISVTNNAGWEPSTSGQHEWIQFDFLGERTLTGVVTLGGGSDITPEDSPPSWVTAYAISYGNDGKNWNPLVNKDGSIKVFQGNSDNIHSHPNMFDLPVRARYLRLMPLKWHNKITLRLQALGCYEPYPELTTEEIVTTTQPTILKTCNVCTGARLPEICPCSEDTWWDGETCTTRTLCPCFIGFIPYAVGSMFDNDHCEQCTCILNGIPQCKPKQCEPCQKDLQSVVNKACGCECRPCPDDKVLCPTSNVCISKTAWCDGYEDCPDDERNCTTPPPPTEKPVVPGKEVLPEAIPEITTVAPTTCPMPKCPPGTYAVELSTNETSEVEVMEGSAWSPFGSRSKWNTYFASGKAKSKMGTKKGGAAKGRSKGGITKTSKLLRSSKLIQEPKCPKYHCQPISEKVEKCPKPACEKGFILEVQKALQKGVCDLYSCVPEKLIPPDGKCNITGRTFETFDGMEYLYDVCDHILARDLVNKTWNVKQMKKCSYVGACQKYLVVTQSDHVIQFNPDLSILYDGYNYTVAQMQKVGAQTGEFAVKQVSTSYLIFTSSYEFSVIWDTQGNARIIVPGSSREMVDGMCGYFDGNKNNDKQRPDGSQAKTSVDFGNSWGDSTSCEIRVCPVNIQNKALEMCKKLKAGPLFKCQGSINMDKMLSHCIESICNCMEASNDTESCRCNAILEAVTECQSQDSNVDLSQWRYFHECTVKCPDGLVYKECFNYACETSCTELMVDGACPQVQECFPGCYCPDGLVKDGDKCVKPVECRDCSCNSYGHSGYNTFDHADYSFGGNCTYVLARTVNGYGGQKFEVLGTGKPCTLDPSETCLDIITILLADHTVQISNHMNKETILKIDEAEIQQLPFTEDWVSAVETPGKCVTVSLLNLHIELEFYYKGKGFYLKMPSQLYFGKTEGLCGSCNLNTTDDFKMQNGTVVTTEYSNQFASNWLAEDLPEVLGKQEGCAVSEVAPPCSLPPPTQDPCLKLMDEQLFGKCHAVVDPNAYVENCHAALCKEVTVTCPFLESYARECQHEGICLEWRTPDLCPYHCPPGLIHFSCGTGCTPTCDNFELYETTPSACTAVPGDTCVCPEGKVLENGTCIEHQRCKPCDDEGHYYGDEWKPDPCKTCKCLSTVECSVTTCTTTVCEVGSKLKVVSGTEDECCPTHICVPEPKEECPEPLQPKCGHGQVMKLETTSSGCKQFVCQCKPPEECEDIEQVLSEKRLPGMQAVIDNSGCCPKVDVVCKVETCPQAPQCPEFHEPVKKETEHCCPEYECKVPDYKCLYEMEFKEGDEGGEVPREPTEKIKILTDLGDIWNDGPCRTCECKEGIVQGSCTTKHCSLPPESDTYVYEPKYIHHKCCPVYKKTACKMDETVYEPGTVWSSPDGNPCKNFTCVNGTDGDLSRQEAVETCKKECQLGWEYEEPAEGSKKCCGECKPVGCVVNGVVHDKGSTWVSNDNCTTYECDILSNDQVQVITSQEQCPDISTCPPEKIYQDKCCKKCNMTTMDQAYCTPIPVNETIGLVKRKIPEHGVCANLDEIHAFNECIGDCKSSTKFNRESADYETICSCCQATKFKVMDIKLTCDDGFETETELSVPIACACKTCMETASQKGKPKKQRRQ